MTVAAPKRPGRSKPKRRSTARTGDVQEELAEARCNTQAVIQVVESLMRPETENEAAGIALDSVRESFEWAYGSFWTLDDAGHSLQFATDSGTVSPEFRRASETASFEKGVGISGRAWECRDLVFVRDIGDVTDCCRAPIAKSVGVKSGMCMPVIVDGDVIGTMDFFSTKHLELSTARKDALRSIARLVSSCIERVRAGERAAAQTRTIESSKASLQKSVSAIDVAVDKLVGAGNELKSSNSVLHSSAEETATQANVVSAAAEEISHGLQAALTGTQQLSASVSEIARNSSDAASVAEDAVKVSETTTEAIEHLGDSSQKIGDVVKVISSIAGQTNLLALNATIEAARAGDAGKGFAVVANEVKELAKQTAAATDDISARIGAIQNSTESAVQAISDITKIINTIYDTQTTIATAVEEQAATTQEIEQRLAQAAQGSGEVAKSICGLAEAAQNMRETVANSNRVGEEVVEICSLLEQTLSDVNRVNLSDPHTAVDGQTTDIGFTAQPSDN